jgi:hypothetical protein
MTIKERIEAAQNKAERFAQWADAAADEATGAELIGLPERAERCRNSSAQHEEDAAVWSATARTLKEQAYHRPPGISKAAADGTPYAEDQAHRIDAERNEALGLAVAS